ncbi:MAG: tetratricopeptide repeat protein [Acidobacteriota bacterium]|nr:tetratricopeptide repeat protein [Acidobacteriota bacterium]
MKKILPGILVTLCCSAIAFSQSDHQMQMARAEKPASLMSGMGAHHHPVSTTNPEAQRFFDQGFSYLYAFNHQEAIRSFTRAAELDPDMAMAYWGIALSLGPNINLDVDPFREKSAYEAAQKARLLSAKAPPNERAYINAVVARYSIDPNADLKKLAVDYKNAMGELVKEYPNDLDAATLYAESAMDLRPWQLWTLDGKPAAGTEEIIAVLESVLRRDPNHIGAIHYYIHTVEASPNPERALVYAAKLPNLIPAAGHLVHMPAHIYQRTGDYEAAARSNRDAAEADRVLFKLSGDTGMYPVMYYNHNLHFLAVARSMEGRFADAMNAALQLEASAAPHVKEMPMLGRFMQTSALMLVRFRRWNDILKLPSPGADATDISLVRHFARGMAYAATGNLAGAEGEQKVFVTVAQGAPARMRHGADVMGDILHLAEKTLSARIALARNDRKAAIDLLRQAVEVQDSMAYDEPPPWFLPVRESLGGVLIQNGDYGEAEKVFRADLERNKRNGRSLFGLMHALKAQNKTEAASLVQREFENAWKYADTRLKLKDL